MSKTLQITMLAAALAILGACSQVAFRGPQGQYAECRADDADCIRRYEQLGFKRAQPPALIHRRSSGCC